jgi:hypothetical protein
MEWLALSVIIIVMVIIMRDIYFARLGGALRCFFHTVEGGVSWREYLPVTGKWGKPESLLEDALPRFTVSAAPKGGLAVVCRGDTGAARMFALAADGSVFESRVEGLSGAAWESRIWPVFGRGGPRMLYNAAANDERRYGILAAAPGGGEPERLGRAAITRVGVFKTVYVSPGHVAAFYSERTGGEYALGYQEATAGKTAAYRVFCQSASPPADFSALIAGDVIYILYVIVSMFGAQLIFRKRTEQGFGKSVVVAEGGRIDGVTMFRKGGRITAAYYLNGVFFTRRSDDGGESFGRQRSSDAPSPGTPEKAVYVPDGSEDFDCREIYADPLNPCAVRPMFEGFFPPKREKPKDPPPREAPDRPAMPDMGVMFAPPPDYQEFVGKMNDQIPEREYSDRAKSRPIGRPHAGKSGGPS